MDNYSKSNSIETIPNCKMSLKTKSLFTSLRDKETITHSELQNIANAICKDLKTSTVRVAFEEIQSNTRKNGRITSKILGVYIYGLNLIRVYKYTAARKKEITPKVALDTLLHELCHHFDYTIIKLTKSIHSSGFYKRIGCLKNSLT